MTSIIAFFKSLSLTTYLYGIIAVAVASGIGMFVHYQRTIGAKDAIIAQTQPVIDSLRAQVKVQAAATEQAHAQVLRDSLVAVKARQATAQASARADVAVANADTARARARRMASDTAATMPVLRAEILALATKTEQADAVHKIERTAWQVEQATSAKDLASVKRELQATKVQLGTTNNLNAQLTAQVAALTGDRPGVIRKYVVPAVTLAGGYWIGTRVRP